MSADCGKYELNVGFWKFKKGWTNQALIPANFPPACRDLSILVLSLNIIYILNVIITEHFVMKTIKLLSDILFTST